MKELILFCFIVTIVTKGYSQLEEDKVLHFLGGNLYGLVGAGVASQISKGDRTWTFVGAIGGSLLIGLAKESIDEHQYNGWDNKDLLATVLGGATVGVTIDLFKQRKKRKREQLFKDAIGSQDRLYLSPKIVPIPKTSLVLLSISPKVLNR
ncbi:hypothetical protein J8L85_12335 [Maribacter sp. MMG018]|uniref:hypothetical protein n=1 Tax=Maribacter sp. MMG018 TaxID=2822688 RepID=UPI001B35E023|nr:hypothetical protein [Maribacter sp. MMG018]MBQ4915233.1 hypothetical protein [Maribacter sp. MMG018]